jgi:hypothetical protein
MDDDDIQNLDEFDPSEFDVDDCMTMSSIR